jgi:hypothetical protein
MTLAAAVVYAGPAKPRTFGTAELKSAVSAGAALPEHPFDVGAARKALGWIA